MPLCLQTFSSSFPVWPETKRKRLTTSYLSNSGSNHTGFGSVLFSCKPAPAAGPLQLLFPLPGACFPSRLPWLPFPHSSLGLSGISFENFPLPLRPSLPLYRFISMEALLSFPEILILAEWVSWFGAISLTWVSAPWGLWPVQSPGLLGT